MADRQDSLEPEQLPPVPPADPSRATGRLDPLVHHRRTVRPERQVDAANPVATVPLPRTAEPEPPPVAVSQREAGQGKERRAPALPPAPQAEVKHGAHARSGYVRIITNQSQGGFRRRGRDVIEALPEATAPRGGLGRFFARIKAALVGTPLSTARLAHERLSNVKALAVFSSDAISSSAYAPGEILIILALAGSGHLGLAVPVGLAILLLLAVVTLSYRQTIRAYPNGGGAYIVAHENLGELPGQVAAGALLVDYILTVSVSVAAGIAAVIAAAPGLAHLRVEMGVVAIILVMLINLRGVRESGTIFAIPTYAFIAIGLALIAVGAVKVATGHMERVVYDQPLVATQGLGLFLILRAFSSGCAALTGVEAISNGVPAFKPPESRNAMTTLLWMSGILGTLFFGMLLLANRYGLHEVENATIVSQLGQHVFGKNVVFYLWQASTAMILMLAANTSFADFPRLSSLLARDGYMPRQFAFRGDRLAFSNGIIALGIAATLILIGFGGEVTRLIPLYAIGVFVSFTLSQGGMVIHWRRNHQEQGWRRSMIINGAGATASAVVAVIIIITKLTGGAWMSIVIGAMLVLLFRAIHQHYSRVDAGLALSDLSAPLPANITTQVVLVPLRSLNRASVKALAYARSIADNVTALHVTDDLEASRALREQWERWAGEIPLLVIESPYRSFTQPILSYIDSLEDRDPSTVITVVLPEFVPQHWWQSLLHGQDALRLKAALLFRPDTVVIDVPQHLPTAPAHIGRRGAGGSGAG
jgi:amino acid transporter